MTGIFIDVYLVDVETAHRTVYHDSFEWEGMPEEQDITPDIAVRHFWLGDETGYFGKQQQYRIEKIVERDTGRLIYQEGN